MNFSRLENRKKVHQKPRRGGTAKSRVEPWDTVGRIKSPERATQTVRFTSGVGIFEYLRTCFALSGLVGMPLSLPRVSPWALLFCPFRILQ